MTDDGIVTFQPLDPGTHVEIQTVDLDTDRETVQITVPRGQGLILEHRLRRALKIVPNNGEAPDAA